MGVFNPYWGGACQNQMISKQYEQGESFSKILEYLNFVGFGTELSLVVLVTQAQNEAILIICRYYINKYFETASKGYRKRAPDNDVLYMSPVRLAQLRQQSASAFSKLANSFTTLANIFHTST